MIQQKLLTPNKYSRPQIKISKVKKVVVHWVANPMSTAIANRNYFESLKDKHVYASAHYIIGLDGEIIQCIPENEVSYHTQNANSFSIGIENCHRDTSGVFSAKTYDSLVSLCVDICKRYNLNPLTDIMRHFDYWNKNCPKWFVEHEDAFCEFKQHVYDQLQGESIKPYTEAINTLFEHGIITEKEKWDLNKLDVANVKYLMKSYIVKSMTQKDMAKILELMSVITTPNAWEDDKNIQIKYIDDLVINMAKKLK